jgi:peptide/nickel transport system ATP-binding protein
MSFLEVNDLRVEFPTSDGLVKAVDGVSFSVNRGETLAIVGESGSGKTVTNLALMGLLSKRASRVSGSAIMKGESGDIELINLGDDHMRAIRGKNIAMIFQDPMSSLHPYYSIGDQIIEAHQVHNGVDTEVSRAKAIELLEMVGIPDASNRMKAFPHQFSGGMRQRVLIAMALVNSPELLIADEPTTALDVTVQAQILKLLRELQRELQMAIILITHDLGVVAGAADRVNVMYAGKIVESAPVRELYANPLMPYTHGLLASIPRMDRVARGESKRLSAISGQPPSLIALPKGCAFAPRCTFSSRVAGGAARCENAMPPLVEHIKGHFARCHLEGASL